MRQHRVDTAELDLAKCIVQTAYVKSVQHDALVEFYQLALENANKHQHTEHFNEEMMKFFTACSNDAFKKYMDVAFAQNSTMRPDKVHTRSILKKMMAVDLQITTGLADDLLMEIKSTSMKSESNYNVMFRMLDYLNKFTPKAGEVYEKKFLEFWRYRNNSSESTASVFGTSTGRYSRGGFCSGVSERAAIMKSIFTCTDENLRYKIARNFLVKQDEVLKKRLLKTVPEFQKLLNLK